MPVNVIAIDGPSYVGKSSIAQSLAELMHCTYINTGHMYRAVAKICADCGIRPDDEGAVVHAAKGIGIRFQTGPGFCRTLVNGKDWTTGLDDGQIVLLASKIAKIGDLRTILTAMQRSYAQREMIIMEGRDIGSVVFPDAMWKFFVTASLEVRAKRMLKMMDEVSKRSCPDYRVLIPKVQAIDEADMNRKIAPLKMAEDAILYDNSESPTAMQDALILQYYITHQTEIVRNADLLKERTAV